MSVDSRHGGYLLSDDLARLDPAAIHAYLTTSYWAAGITRETVTRSLRHSLCVGAYDPPNGQVGLARVITDRTTFAYLCDVYVLAPHRGRGLGKALIAAVLAHPDLQGLRLFNLLTRDAHGLYRRFGFLPTDRPEAYMERRLPKPLAPPDKISG